MKYFLAIIPLLVFQMASAQLMMPDNSSVEAQVRQVFADVPAMVEVARCESGFRQYTNAGTVLHGGTGGNYIGVFQIAASHQADAQSLGMDIYTTEGNLAYARHMYDQSGTRPWFACAPALPVAAPVATLAAVVNASADISTTTPAANPGIPASPEPLPHTTPSVASYALTMNLTFGMTTSQVAVLQKLLNAAGFSVAASGPGSSGNETTRFGQLTREAVKKFQCTKQIICEGNESTTGFGRVGPKTRTSLLAAANQ